MTAHRSTASLADARRPRGGRPARPRGRSSSSLGASAQPVAAHGPDPTVGGKLWSPNQVVTFQWRAGQVPPDWMATPIVAAAADASLTRSARAATFTRTTSAPSLISYGEPTGCSSAGIACFDRAAAPKSFSMWFRAQGARFDWGTLRWCQGLTTIANGCFDVETIALDEFGHVEDLGHHVNLADGSDFLDAVVQTVSRARPDLGWQVHAFGPCDTGRLQLLYDRLGRGGSRLELPRRSGRCRRSRLRRPASMIGSSVEFTATLRTTSSTSANGALANDPLSGRPVVLQRRPVGSSTWTTMGTMARGTSEGSYVLSMSPTATYEWRALFIAVGDRRGAVVVVADRDGQGQRLLRNRLPELRRSMRTLGGRGPRDHDGPCRLWRGRLSGRVRAVDRRRRRPRAPVGVRSRSRRHRQPSRR